MHWLWYFFGFLVAFVTAARVWRCNDRRADQQAWSQLLELGRGESSCYHPALVADLPEPARRFFNYTIAPGTALTSVVEIDMTGELGLGTRDQSGYRPMQARQLLAPPHGLVWQLRSGPVSGSDGITSATSWTRFWLLNLVPVVRVSGPDHHRSAFGRVVAEAAFWAPASLLPGPHVHWEALDHHSARALMRGEKFSQAVELTVNEEGAPTRVVIQRWTNANPEKAYREQPFGGYLSEFRDFGGYRLPTCVEGGNLIDTPDYFPFYRARVTAVRFPLCESRHSQG